MNMLTYICSPPGFLKSVVWIYAEYYTKSRLKRQGSFNIKLMALIQKCGAEIQKLPLDENIDKAVEISDEIVVLDEALPELARPDPQQSRLV